MNTVTPTTVTDYSRAVHAALSDAPSSEARAMLDGLDDHLTEIAAEGDLDAILGSPSVYAAELRAACLDRTVSPAQRIQNTWPSLPPHLSISDTPDVRLGTTLNEPTSSQPNQHSDKTSQSQRRRRSVCVMLVVFAGLTALLVVQWSATNIGHPSISAATSASAPIAPAQPCAHGQQPPYQAPPAGWVIVPDLCGAQFISVNELLIQLGLMSEFIQGPQGDYGNGRVQYIEPAPGTAVRIGSTVTMSDDLRATGKYLSTTVPSTQPTFAPIR